MDIADLKDALKEGVTIEEAAAFLCRSGTVDDVATKAREVKDVLMFPDSQKDRSKRQAGDYR